MKITSPTYASKIALAQALAGLNCRAVTITAVARTKAIDSRVIYKQIHKSQSEPGQTPTNHNWFLMGQDRRKHGAMLLILYAKFRLIYQDVNDSHGIAFALALRRYKMMTAGNEVVSPERFNLLVTWGFSLNWKNILKGDSSKFEYGNVKLMLCKKCRTPHIVESHYLNYICQSHKE